MKGIAEHSVVYVCLDRPSRSVDEQFHNNTPQKINSRQDE